MIRVNQIKLGIDEPISQLKSKCAKKLNIKETDIKDLTIYKESIDARSKDIMFVYTIDVKVNKEESVIKKSKGKFNLTPDMRYKFPEKGEHELDDRIVVVGMGPAGLFCGLLLAEMGYKPLIIERGEAVEARSKSVSKFWQTGILNTESNVQFGEGGAGTFSDGKLTTRIKDLRCRKVLNEFVLAGSPSEILYSYKPHIGTDILKDTVVNIRKKIIELGGEVRFNTRLDKIITVDGSVDHIIVNNDNKIKTNAVVLAIGHSARDTFEHIHEIGVEILQKPFAIGVRAEHPQSLLDKAQYGKYAGHPKLGSADYKLTYHSSNGRSVYSFCMCPGGEVVAAASEDNRLVTNGMSEYKRDKENGNSAILVSITPEDFGSTHPLAGMFFQRKLEEDAYKAGGSNYNAPAQLIGDLLNNKPSTNKGTVNPSYKPDVRFTDLRETLPDFVIDAIQEAIPAFDKKLRGFAISDGVLTGVETRSSSPIRIIRNNESLESMNTKGLYPCGEGAGYAGGIISAAVDGIKVAEKIITKYK